LPGGRGALINAGSYCTRCQPRNGSTRQWRKLRDQILARDRYTCPQCGGPARHVDHVVSVARGGTDHPGNLDALCASCNLRKGAGLDPAPLEEYATHRSVLESIEGRRP
jgi:5-methylcytosine-specific restriction endonuclease McrA